MFVPGHPATSRFLAEQHFIRSVYSSVPQRAAFLPHLSRRDRKLDKKANPTCPCILSTLVTDSNHPTFDPDRTADLTRSVVDSAPHDAVLPPGAVVARYTIGRVLGIGGMGAVYLATQDKPHRPVALKLIRPGYASPRLLKRFEIEAEILGRLNHPNIARVYEAGIAESPIGARPFFAMELVEGVPLDDYARSHALSTHDRLFLFAQICDAVHHAHAHGVIHRDLKPGNILVDQSGQPKILDFGVARATDSDIQQTTLHTDIGQLIGTVPYMSPEQAGGDPAELDTRSDVYALGVVLYELLVGRLPYNLDQKLIHEAVRIIREDDPTPLSSINRTLRGDVDTIVATALAKEKARRYPSADALASDIRRYLRDEPISARPASSWYQIRKFTRRNRALVGGIALAFVVLLAGIAATSWQAVAATQARDQAQQNLARAEKAESAAKARADELEKVAAFQSSQLSGIDTALMGSRLRQAIIDSTPEGQRSALESALAGVNFTDIALGSLDQNIFDRALKAIEREFKDQPLIKARLLDTVASTLEALGRLGPAMAPQAEALEIRRRLLGDEHADTLESLSTMGRLLVAQGRLVEATPYYRSVVDGRKRVLGDDDVNTLIAINNMGFLHEAQENPEEALACYTEGLDRARRVLGSDSDVTLALINNMGRLLMDQGSLDEAEPHLSEGLERSRRMFGDDDPDTIIAIHNMGYLCEAQGKTAEAESYYREALERSRRVLGNDHPSTITSVSNLAVLLEDDRRLPDAEPLYREALERRRRVLGDDHVDTLASINRLAVALDALGNTAEAEPLFREELERSRRVLGDDHIDTLSAIDNFADVLLQNGELAEAEPYYREVLERRRRVLGDDHPDTLISISNMGFLLERQGRLADAEPCYRECLEASRRVLGNDHPDTLLMCNNLGRLLQARGRFDEALQFSEEALAGRRRILGADHPSTLLSIYNLSMLLKKLGRFDEAEPLAIECHERNLAIFGAEHSETTDAIELLISLYTSWNTAEPGKGYDTKAAEWQAKLDANSPGAASSGKPAAVQ